MKKYSINVHYDYFYPIEIEAENTHDALKKAKNIADEMPLKDALFRDFTDACITAIEEIKTLSNKK